MLQELQDLGLSEKEARVYLAALELGNATAERLALHAKVNRSTTYVQLESLMKMGLMSTYEEGKKTLFAPEAPELLSRLLQQQKNALENRERDLARVLPVLMRQFEGAGERPLVRFFPGQEGITKAREEVLASKEKHIYVIFTPGLLSQLYSQDELDAYSDRRRALGIHSKGIFIHAPRFVEAGLDRFTDRRFISPDQLPLTIDVVIFGDKTAIYSLRGSVFAMVIESTQIANSMKMLFDFLWMHAEGPGSASRVDATINA